MGDPGILDFWPPLWAQVRAPFSFRFVVQPLLAILLGLRDAKLDARAGSRPFLLSLLRGRLDRRERLKEGLRAIAVPFAVAILLDGVVQLLVDGWVRPLRAASPLRN